MFFLRLSSPGYPNTDRGQMGRSEVGMAGKTGTCLDSELSREREGNPSKIKSLLGFAEASI